MGYPTDEMIEKAHGWNPDRQRLSEADSIRLRDGRLLNRFNPRLSEIIGILDEYAFAKRWLGDVAYNAIALGEESGEVLGKVKKWMRDDGTFPNSLSDERRDQIATELGDVLFYWAYACDSLGLTPQKVFDVLVKKIASRRERGTQHGGGDNR